MQKVLTTMKHFNDSLKEVTLRRYARAVNYALHMWRFISNLGISLMSYHIKLGKKQKYSEQGENIETNSKILNFVASINFICGTLVSD